MPGPIKASCRKLAQTDALKRSSVSVTALDGRVFVFGGELVARQPRDADVHVVNADGKASTLTSSSSNGPTPRVGASMVALDQTLYVFGGRGGESMSALPESGSFWTFDTTNSAWSLLSPHDLNAPYPEPRSYHTAVTDGRSQIFVHAGCPASGRLRDFWAFDITARTWKQLPSAPGPERGGTSICFAVGKVWRMGGFDGKAEIGGVIDSFDLATGAWESHTFAPDGSTGPGARSVAALLPLDIGGKAHLVSIFGEADPSSLGHAGAGKMLGDVWAFETESKTWRRVDTDGGQNGNPAPRGWFGAAVNGDRRLVVLGGLGEDNERLDDAWALEF